MIIVQLGAVNYLLRSSFQPLIFDYCTVTVGAVNYLLTSSLQPLSHVTYKNFATSRNFADMLPSLIDALTHDEVKCGPIGVILLVIFI